MIEKFKYIKYFKPFGVVSSFTDPENRNSLKDDIGIPDVYAAGRLDRDSEGLLLLTDDGKLIHRLTQPEYHIPKTYYVQVEGLISADRVEQLKKGVQIQGVRTKPCQVDYIPEPNLPRRSKDITPHAPTCWLKITLQEGKKRQIRHMTAKVGYPTLRLVRVAIGPITIDDLQPGEWHALTQEEVRQLLNYREGASDLRKLTRVSR